MLIVFTDFGTLTPRVSMAFGNAGPGRRAEKGADPAALGQVGFDVQRQTNSVAHDPSASRDRDVEVYAVVSTVELPGRDEGQLGPHPSRRGYGSLERRVQHNRTGDALDGEVALYLPALALDVVDLGAAEVKLGVLFDVQKAIALEAVVGCVVGGVKAGRVDGDLDRGLARYLSDVEARRRTTGTGRAFWSRPCGGPRRRDSNGRRR